MFTNLLNSWKVRLKVRGSQIAGAPVMAFMENTNTNSLTLHSHYQESSCNTYTCINSQNRCRGVTKRLEMAGLNTI